MYLAERVRERDFFMIYRAFHFYIYIHVCTHITPALLDVAGCSSAEKKEIELHPTLT